MTLRELRLQAKKTVTEVATVLGKSQTAVYSYEQGARRLPLEDVLILAKFFDCTVEEVIKAQLVSIQIGQPD